MFFFKIMLHLLFVYLNNCSFLLGFAVFKFYRIHGNGLGTVKLDFLSLYAFLEFYIFHTNILGKVRLDWFFLLYDIQGPNITFNNNFPTLSFPLLIQYVN